MLKYMIDAHQESLECSGELMHLAAESTRLIQLIYGKLKRSDPGLAESYRQIIRCAILATDGPLFTGDNVTGNVLDIAMITPNRKDGRS